MRSAALTGSRLELTVYVEKVLNDDTVVDQQALVTIAKNEGDCAAISLVDTTDPWSLVDVRRVK